MIIYMYVGVDELHVDSQLFGSFTLKASLHRDSAEDICRKVSDYTKVSTAYMQLYARYIAIIMIIRPFIWGHPAISAYVIMLLS